MFKESKGIRDIHSLYESIYIADFNIENQLVSLQETVGFNDLTEDDLIELTDLIESVEFASLTEEEKRNMLQKVQDKLAGSKRAGFLGQLERTRRKVFGTKKEKEQTKKFDDEHENVPGEGIKSKLKGKDAEDDKKEKELEIVINNSKKGDSKKSESDSKSKNGNSTFLSLSGSKDKTDNKTDNRARITVGGKTYYKGDPGYDAAMKKSGPDEATSTKGVIQKDLDAKAKKQKEASDDEKGANEWGPGGQPSASKQIDAYKKGRPSPASFKTNQRQTRELIKKQSKEVYPSVTKQDLNQFNRTKKYSADDGSQVERSTVFTKHYKTGKPLGVMTGSQRKAYDKAAAAHKAGTTTTPKPDTSGNEAKEASKAAALARRNAKLVDKGLNPPKSSTPKNFVETNPKTHYTSKIGAFLNNKKKGDLKGTTKHTITKIDHNNEEYDAYDLVLNYIMESKQASSIEEANYIMMEMDQNTIHEIVQTQKKSLGEGWKLAAGAVALAAPWAMSQLEKRWNPVKKARDKYQDKKATEYEKKSGTTKKDGYFR